jgi:NADH-quinone oxidoreductase subunit N
MEFFDNIYRALPEIIVLITACTALLGDLFFGHRIRTIAFAISIIGLFCAMGATILLIGQSTQTLFHDLFVSDDYGQIMILFIEITVLLSLIYAKPYLHARKIPGADYCVLGLFSTLGMMVLVSAHSMLSIYLGLELLSLPLYALTAIQRDKADGSEAAMKYIIMGAIASGLLLYGISLLYGATDSLDLQDIARAISTNGAPHAKLLSFALVFIVAGIGFKCAAIPFHMWVPDVYAGAPTSVTLFIGAAPKIAGIAMALRILTLGLAGLSSQWQLLLLVLALLSTGLGNLLAIIQTNIKRLFGYSAISHMGYALFGMVALTLDGYAATLYYVVIYALTSVAAFGLLVLMSHKGYEIEMIDDLKGLNKRDPWLAFMMMITLLSMAGIPPVVGFFAKLWVLKALVDVQLTWVAILGLVFAVIGAFYYLRIIKAMYFDEPQKQNTIVISSGMRIIYSINCLALLFLGIFPSALMTLCMNSM